MNRQIYIETGPGGALAKQIAADVCREVIPAIVKALKPHLSTQSDKYLTNREIQDIFKISRSTLYRLTRQRHLPCHKIGRKSLYNMSDVKAVLQILNINS
jgi:excisionase family DNA binding protein